MFGLLVVRNDDFFRGEQYPTFSDEKSTVKRDRLSTLFLGKNACRASWDHALSLSLSTEILHPRQLQDLGAGRLHPLLKVRKEFREIFLEMGFEEMPTQR